jgi:hypothetical protein
MRNTNITERSFSWGSAFLILLIPPIIWALSGSVYCRIVICELESLIYLIFPPIFYILEIIIFFICRFLINKISPKKPKEYKIALLLTGVIFISMFFLGPELPMTGAYLTKNAIFCKWLSGYNKNECIEEVIKVKKDESLCELAEDKESCYFHVAGEKEDPNLCEKSGSWKDYCYWQVAVKKKDVNLCKKAGKHKERCFNNTYKAMAIYEDNPNLCKKIMDEVTYNICYYELAQKKKDVALCEEIKNNPGYLEICYEEITGKVSRPDLIIESVNIEPSSPKIGDTLKFFVIVKNIGERNAEKFEVSVHKDSWGNRASINKLAPNEEKEVIILLYIKSPNQTGSQNFTIEVDDLNEIRESKETNNELKKEIYIAPK